MIKVDVKVEVNLDNLGKEIEDSLQKFLRDLTAYAAGEWKALALQYLHSTRDIYDEAIHTEVVDPWTSHVVLQHSNARDNWIVTALEVGVESFNIKDAVMKKRGGVPVNIPFRTKGAGRQDKPNEYRRMTVNSTAKWQHPGFRPTGAGGLKKPLREILIEQLNEEIPDKVNQVLKSVLA